MEPNLELALQAAAANAKANADALLKPFGKHVGAVLTVVQSGAPAPPVKYARAAEASLDAHSSETSTEISTGQISVSASVTIIFSIE